MNIGALSSSPLPCKRQGTSDFTLGPCFSPQKITEVLHLIPSTLNLDGINNLDLKG